MNTVNAEKSLRFKVKTFFFGDHPVLWRKSRYQEKNQSEDLFFGFYPKFWIKFLFISLKYTYKVLKNQDWAKVTKFGRNCNDRGKFFSGTVNGRRTQREHELNKFIIDHSHGNLHIERPA